MTLHFTTSWYYKLIFPANKFSISYLQVNTEPAKSMSFRLVVNEEEVEGGVSEEAAGRNSEDAATRGEIMNPHGFEDLGESGIMLTKDADVPLHPN